MFDLEKKVLELLKDFCEQDISAETNLFWSGLNSLNFIMLITRIEEELHFKFVDEDLVLSNFITPKIMITVIRKYLVQI